jgi:hypothetical protein
MYIYIVALLVKNTENISEFLLCYLVTSYFTQSIFAMKKMIWFCILGNVYMILGMSAILFGIPEGGSL